MDNGKKSSISSEELEKDILEEIIKEIPDENQAENPKENSEENSENENETDAEAVDHAKKFIESVEKVNKLYLIIIIVSFLIAGGGIACAVIYKVSLGLLLLILAIVVYAAATVNLLYSKLGVAYRLLHGCVTVSELYGKDREVVYIPSRLLLCPVTEIGNRAFAHKSSQSIKEIHLPKSLIRIGSNAFAGLDSLTDVYYEGTEEEWLTLSRLAPLNAQVALHFEEKLPMPIKVKKVKKSKKNNENNESIENTENTENTEGTDN